MSVTRVKLIQESYSQAGGKRSGSRIYRVEVDDLTHDSEDMLTATDGSTAIPTIGVAWKSGDTAKVKTISATGDQDDQQTYLVTANYSSADGAETIENPLARPTDYSWSGSEESEPYFRDVDDEPVVNSAGEDFE